MSYQILIGRLLMYVRPAPLAAGLKWILRCRRVELLTSEGTFWIDPGSVFGVELARGRSWELHTLAAIKRLVGSGDTFVDIGANEGYFSVVASRCAGPAGRVIAVEPQTRLQMVLRRNISLNQGANSKVVPVTISDSAHPMQFHLTPDMNTGASGLTAFTRYRLPTQTTDCLTLSGLFDAFRIADGAVVKMDIESWEYEAVLGSRELFRAGRVRALILELHSTLLARRNRRAEDVTDFLNACAYECLPDFPGGVWVRQKTRIGSQEGS
jgi:FkbM family methyltransferase